MKKLLMGLLTMVMLFGACAQADYQAGEAAEGAGSDELAMQYWTEAAEQGDAESAKALGDWYLNGTHVNQDYAAALEWYLKAAEQGDKDALFNIGLI